MNAKVLATLVVTILITSSSTALILYSDESDGNVAESNLSAVPAGYIPVSNYDDFIRVGSGESYGGYTWSSSAKYMQTNNIVASSTPLPPKTMFYGTYDGCGYGIHDVIINSYSTEIGFVAGLFPWTGTGCTLTGINLYDMNAAFHNQGVVRFGSLVGGIGGLGTTITNCQATNTTFEYTSNNEALAQASGLIGFVSKNPDGTAYIKDCYTAGFSVWMHKGSKLIGSGNGFIELVFDGTTVENCFSYDASLQCYLFDAFSRGLTKAIKINLYYINSELASNSGAIKITTSTMQSAYVGFDFISVWEMGDNHPVFRSVKILNPPESMSVQEGETWSYTPQTDPSDAVISMSGVPWLSISGGTISGIVPSPSGDTEVFTLILKASYFGQRESSVTVVITVYKNIYINSIPTVNIEGGATWKYTPVISDWDSNITVEGASWLSISGGLISGVSPIPQGNSDVYDLVITAKKGLSEVVQNVTLTVYRDLGFTSIPEPLISITNISVNTYFFDGSGSEGYNSLRWNLGNGVEIYALSFQYDYGNGVFSASLTAENGVGKKSMYHDMEVGSFVITSPDVVYSTLDTDFEYLPTCNYQGVLFYAQNLPTGLHLVYDYEETRQLIRGVPLVPPGIYTVTLEARHHAYPDRVFAVMDIRIIVEQFRVNIEYDDTSYAGNEMAIRVDTNSSVNIYISGLDQSQDSWLWDPTTGMLYIEFGKAGTKNVTIRFETQHGLYSYEKDIIVQVRGNEDKTLVTEIAPLTYVVNMYISHEKLRGVNNIGDLVDIIGLFGFVHPVIGIILSVVGFVTGQIINDMHEAEDGYGIVWTILVIGPIPTSGNIASQ